MAAPPSIDLSGWMAEHLEQASPDLLRAMLGSFVEALMGADADAICNAPYGVRTDERTNTRNGYRHRDWDTRAGTIDVAIPKPRITRVLSSPRWADSAHKSRGQLC